MIIPQWGSLIAIQNAAKKYEDIVEVDAKKDDRGFTILKIVVKPQYNIDFVKDFLENHVPIGTGYYIFVDTSMDNKKNPNEDEPMKCNLECPYSKPNGRDTNGNQNIICESRKWYMTDTDDCIEKFDKKTISQLKGIFGDTIMPREKFRVFTEIPTNEKMIVNMITDDELTLEEACKLLNEQNQDIKQLKILVESLKMDNKKLKGRLTDLGVEYY